MISVIVSASGKTRLQEKNFATVIKALANQRYRKFEVIVVEQLMAEDYLYENTNIKGIDCKHVKLPRQKENRFFNLAWSRNAGHNKADGDKFLFLDCDIVCDENYLEAVAEFDSGHFVAWNQLYYLNKEESDEVHRSEKIKLQEEIVKQGCGTSIFGDAGKSVCMTRDFFFNVVGGFNESMCGWGGEDNEMACRASRVLSKFFTMKYKLLHLWHPRGNGTDYDQHPSHNMWRISNDHPHEVTKRIIEAGFGKITGPTEIKLDDLGWK
jgi:glycosyltransferase involved in cell wall biosynthesis